tara:strand:- start:10519 stop:10743 length:225 start_codon:yes stop_codon:yes gene_type:complete
MTHIDHELLMQVALFTSLVPDRPENFKEGQVEWLTVLVEQAVEFCEFTADIDWAQDDWYEASEHWLNKTVEALL